MVHASHISERAHRQLGVRIRVEISSSAREHTPTYSYYYFWPIAHGKWVALAHRQLGGEPTPRAFGP